MWFNTREDTNFWGGHQNKLFILIKNPSLRNHDSIYAAHNFFQLFVVFSSSHITQYHRQTKEIKLQLSCFVDAILIYNSSNWEASRTHTGDFIIKVKYYFAGYVFKCESAAGGMFGWILMIDEPLTDVKNSANWTCSENFNDKSFKVVV